MNTYSGNTTVDGGTLQVSAGQLTSPTVYVGNSLAGCFAQSGGTNSVSSFLYLGANAGSNGTYNLSGSGLLSAQVEYVGNYGTGSFTQTGGTHSVANYLELGGNAGSSGAYNLSGSGLLTAGYEHIGDAGTGSFAQTGGTHRSPTPWFSEPTLAAAERTISAAAACLPQAMRSTSADAGTGSFTQIGRNPLGRQHPVSRIQRQQQRNVQSRRQRPAYRR